MPTADTAPLWPWLAGGGVGALLLAGLFYHMRRRKDAGCNNLLLSKDDKDDETDKELMSSICELLEREQLFLNSNLKVVDVAKLLGTNSTYVSRCINSQRGCTFTQLVNAYRIEHAKELLNQQPDIKIAVLCAASGFANQTSFFRAFKTVTGISPKEWIAQKD